jgi:hypothetical protein
MLRFRAGATRRGGRHRCARGRRCGICTRSCLDAVAESRRTVAESPAAEVVAVAFAVDPVIPDLSPAGLQLARTVLSAAAGGQALVATYVGPRGCRLELWVSNASMSATASGGTERRRWQVNGLVYELIAFGMPAARFEKVANAAEKATRATVLPDEADRQLIEARVSTALPRVR